MHLTRVGNIFVTPYNKARPGDKLYIPDPNTLSDHCNFLMNDKGLVTYKKYVLTSREKRELIKKHKDIITCQPAETEEKSSFFNYIFVEPDQNLSSLIYSIFLQKLWNEDGIMDKIYKINHIHSDKDLQYKSVFLIPNLDKANSCNFTVNWDGRISPKKYISTTEEKNELLETISCEEAPIITENNQVKPVEEEKKPFKPTKSFWEMTKEWFSGINIKHEATILEIMALTNFRFAESDVSDVKLDIFSAYGAAFNAEFRFIGKRYINFYSQFEYYNEIKNRGLKNNFIAKKWVSLEQPITQYVSLTGGFAEPWYVENLEVDEFEFVSLIVPYLGVAYRDDFNENYQFRSELGILSQTDLLSRDRIKSGFFLTNRFQFYKWGYNFSTGFNIEYVKFNRYYERDMAISGGLNYKF